MPAKPKYEVVPYAPFDKPIVTQTVVGYPSDIADGLAQSAAHYLALQKGLEQRRESKYEFTVDGVLVRVTFRDGNVMRDAEYRS